MFEGGLYPYWIVIFLMMTGLYVVISRDNLVKKIIGLGIFQVSVIMFYVAMGKVRGGTAPIEADGGRQQRRHDLQRGQVVAHTGEVLEDHSSSRSSSRISSSSMVP
jgi:multicomponent Na+:H+ antiporter subunit C